MSPEQIAALANGGVPGFLPDPVAAAGTSVPAPAGTSVPAPAAPAAGAAPTMRLAVTHAAAGGVAILVIGVIALAFAHYGLKGAV